MKNAFYYVKLLKNTYIELGGHLPWFDFYADALGCTSTSSLIRIVLYYYCIIYLITCMYCVHISIFNIHVCILPMFLCIINYITPVAVYTAELRRYTIIDSRIIPTTFVLDNIIWIILFPSLSTTIADLRSKTFGLLFERKHMLCTWRYLLHATERSVEIIYGTLRASSN